MGMLWIWNIINGSFEYRRKPQRAIFILWQKLRSIAAISRTNKLQHNKLLQRMSNNLNQLYIYIELFWLNNLPMPSSTTIFTQLASLKKGTTIFIYNCCTDFHDGNRILVALKKLCYTQFLAPYRYRSFKIKWSSSEETNQLFQTRNPKGESTRQTVAITKKTN